MEIASKEYTVLLEKDEDGWIVATVPEIPGCYTQGKTIAEAIERIQKAIEVCLESEENIKPMKFIGIQRIAISQ